MCDVRISAIGGCVGGSGDRIAVTLTSTGPIRAAEGVLAGAPDPTIIRAPNGKQGYYVFATGSGTAVWFSPDLFRWKMIARVFDDAVPGWAREAVPGTRGIWAPDISCHDGLYHLYYSVSTFGSQRSVIGLAVNRSVDPQDSAYKWEDRGPGAQRRILARSTDCRTARNLLYR